MVLLSCVQRGEAELPALLDPTERQAVSQFSEGQIRRLPSIEERFHNVGSEKSALQNPAHVSLVETELLCNGSLTRNFSGHDPFVPLASACQGFQ
jgi:hypothetical protein